MKLLMITRKVDRHDHLAGFIYSWVRALSKHVDELYVLSWQEGDASDLPANTHVYQLPTKANVLRKIWLFEKHLLQILPRIDGVFCHQMPVYTILAAPFSRLYRKRMVSWYLHRSTDWRMRLMTLLTNTVVTASPESFRLKSKKVVVLSHGIDVETFKPAVDHTRTSGSLITVGRISPTKDYESMILAVNQLVKQGKNDIKLTIVGAPGLPEQEAYLKSLKKIVTNCNLTEHVFFAGPVANRDITPLLQNADIFINMSGTGSLDKAVLEAMACGCVVVTSNEAFANMLPADLLVPQNNPQALASALEELLNRSSSERRELGLKLRTIVTAEHALDPLMQRIVDQYTS